jgi:exonuclease III
LFCKLRVKGKFHNITTINVYVPTEVKEVGVKEQFYRELQRTHDAIIILGDMNAKIGKGKNI